MDRKTKAAGMLQSARLRHTAPRTAILEILLAAEAPLTREQIAERIGEAAPNKTTIYRTLMSLVEKGLVHEAYVEERTRHFELSHHCGEHQCHPHFTCTRCRQTHCMTEVSTPLVELPQGWRMERQQIRIEGVCSTCMKK